MKFYLLELIVTTTNKVVCEPLGVYSTIKKAKENLKKVREHYPKAASESNMLNIIDFELDCEPAILQFSEDDKYDYAADSLLSLLNEGVLEQMIEPDGSFSYVLTKKYKNGLEKLMSDIASDKRNYE